MATPPDSARSVCSKRPTQYPARGCNRNYKLIFAAAECSGCRPWPWRSQPGGVTMNKITAENLSPPGLRLRSVSRTANQVLHNRRVNAGSTRWSRGRGNWVGACRVIDDDLGRSGGSGTGAPRISRLAGDAVAMARSRGAEH